MYIVIFNPTNKNYGILETDKEHLAGFNKEGDAELAAEEAKKSDKSLKSFSIFKECIYNKK
jgi:hypothetical protein